MGETASNRRIVALTGKDALPFLQGIVSNDVLPLARAPGLVWTALLTPQGKYLADFFKEINAASAVYVSAISSFEIALKTGAGKLELSRPVEEWSITCATTPPSPATGSASASR